ncbi:hypothetical protein JXD20_02720 [Candidatus Peregrinibacteria bacterium]|nr:hypothetical protein [Candidatus Peregrinibacteria bacterium]
MGINEAPYQGTFAELNDADLFQIVEENGRLGREAFQKIDGRAFLIDKKKRGGELLRSAEAESVIVSSTRVRLLGNFGRVLPVSQ